MKNFASFMAVVMFQAPGVSNIDFKAQLKARPEVTSPTVWQVRARPTAANRETLLRKFAAAQEGFVSGNVSTAKELFLQVVAMKNTDDWKTTEREILMFSFLRLAQLENETASGDTWLLESISIGNDLEPDRKLFPPPLMARRQELMQKLPRLEWPALPPDWSMVLINGRSCQRGSSCPLLLKVGDKVQARLTFLSDQWVPFTMEISLKRISEATPQQEAWVAGACQQDSFHPLAGGLARKSAFWGENCALNDDQIAADPQVQTLRLPEPVSPKKMRFYESKWFWAGVGVVTAAIIISTNQNKDKPEEKQEPTTSYGY